MSKWYADWQSSAHVDHFDFRSRVSDRNLERNYDSYNDIRLLRERLVPDRDMTLLEVGCATGELFRYVRRRYPRTQYLGVDISAPALARAREKYPDATFEQIDPSESLNDVVTRLGSSSVDVVYAKDVLHHQERPLSFLSQLIQVAGDSIVLRCRTRDVGPTEWDPERSCQYHYDGWMPYIVINVDELVSAVRLEAPEAEIRLIHNHMVLGGLHARYLPKECYVQETRTAETALGLFLRTDAPGRVSIEDRQDRKPSYTLTHLLRSGARGVMRRLQR
jgi:SAM-dependent methyltransferase